MPTLFAEETDLTLPATIIEQFRDKRLSATLAAGMVASWLADVLPDEVTAAIPAAIVEQSSKAHQGVPRPDELKTVLDWWNGLAERGLVPAAVNASKPSKEIVAAWRVFLKDAELQEMMADLGAVGDAIEASSFCRKGWFVLPKLLRGSTNGDKTVMILRKLLQGGYRDAEAANDRPDPEAELQLSRDRHRHGGHLV